MFEGIEEVRGPVARREGEPRGRQRARRSRWARCRARCSRSFPCGSRPPAARRPSAARDRPARTCSRTCWGRACRSWRRGSSAYREARREAGHDPDAGRVALMLHTFVGDDDADLVRATVRGPFREYLRTSFDLVLRLASGAAIRPVDPVAGGRGVDAGLRLRALLRHQRADGHAGASAWRRCGRLRGIGVDEVACLVDFGVDEDLVLEPGPDALTDVMRRSREEQPADARADGARWRSASASTASPTCSARPPWPACWRRTPTRARRSAGLECILLGGEALPPPLAAAASRGDRRRAC